MHGFALQAEEDQEHCNIEEIPHPPGSLNSEILFAPGSISAPTSRIIFLPSGLQLDVWGGFASSEETFAERSFLEALRSWVEWRRWEFARAELAHLEAAPTTWRAALAGTATGTLPATGTAIGTGTLSGTATGTGRSTATTRILAGVPLALTYSAPEWVAVLGTFLCALVEYAHLQTHVCFREKLFSSLQDYSLWRMLPNHPF